MASLPQSVTKTTLAAKRPGSAIAPRSASTPSSIGAAAAKAQLLHLLNVVEQERKAIPITKRGRVVAHLVPAPEEKPVSNFDRVFGESRGLIKITGDIVSPNWEDWGPEWR